MCDGSYPPEEEEDERISSFSFSFQGVLFGFNRNVHSWRQTWRRGRGNRLESIHTVNRVAKTWKKTAMSQHQFLTRKRRKKNWRNDTKMPAPYSPYPYAAIIIYYMVFPPVPHSHSFRFGRERKKEDILLLFCFFFFFFFFFKKKQQSKKKVHKSTALWIRKLKKKKKKKVCLWQKRRGAEQIVSLMDCSVYPPHHRKKMMMRKKKKKKGNDI